MNWHNINIVYFIHSLFIHWNFFHIYVKIFWEQFWYLTTMELAHITNNISQNLIHWRPKQFSNIELPLYKDDAGLVWIITVGICIIEKMFCTLVNLLYLKYDFVLQLSFHKNLNMFYLESDYTNLKHISELLSWNK